LWFGVGFSVRVDGSAGFHSPDHFEGRSTTVLFEIRDNGVVRQGRVESGRPCSVLKAAYRIVLENQEIASGFVRARNWYVTYGIMFAMFTVLFCLLFFVLSLNHAS
jgi:hypothetical protein